jgi:proteasome lid subunit RPN8/RPN11
MIDHAKAEYPYECCGMIAGRDESVSKIVKMKNEVRSSIEYSMDDASLKLELEKLDDEGLDLIGVYHSHPTSRAYPSNVDISKAVFPEIDYVIISLMDKDNPEIKNYKIKDNAPYDEPYNITD